MRYFITFALMLVLYANSANAEEVTGRARAIDGDTLKVGKTTVRLFGIDAPELKQTCITSKGKTQRCGDLARQSLNVLIANIKVKCRGEGKDSDGALVATCYAGPFDVNEQMVAAGWALSVKEETDIYVRAESFARARNEGMWRGTFDTPQKWRDEHPAR